VYDVTSDGEAAHEALLALEEGLQRVGGLQTVVLRQILALLVEIVEAASAEQPDGAVLYTRLEELHRSFKALTGNAAIFMQKVHRLLRSPVVEVAEFQVFKAETIAYLAGFMAELTELADEVRGQLDALDALGEPRRAAALAAAAAASGERALDGRDAEAVWIGLTEQHLAGLAGWFRASVSASAGAAVLSATVRNAVLGIARAVERIREAALAPSSRAADLLALARWFEAVPDEQAAHRLWHVAFGLASARHLTHSGEEVPASTSWWEAPRSDYPVRLRFTTSGDRVRRASKIADHARSKRVMAERVRHVQDAYDRAADILASLGTTQLSKVDGIVDDACLDLLANLVARAEKQPQGRDGWRRTRSVDGRLRIALREPAPGTATRLVTVRGLWTMRDYEVQISAGRGQSGRRVVGPREAAASVRAGEE
jgi:uncharacterized protein (TIGR02677 family)